MQCVAINIVVPRALRFDGKVTVPVFFHPNMENKNEQVQGTNMVDAAKEVGVKFFIWTYAFLSPFYSYHTDTRQISSQHNEFVRRQV